MLKGVKKGVKKKLGLKSKKQRNAEEDDIFDVDKLEKLKRELEEKRKAEGGSEAGDEQSSTAPQQEKSEQEDEEWAKFKVLTAAVDTVVKKTQDELEQIKETSFFQRKVTDPTNLWRPESEKVAEAVVEEEKPVTPPPEPEPEPQPDLTELEPVNLEDDLFDTSIYDNIKFNYIPESPTEEEGDDPFAYSADVAVVVKRVEEAEKRAKRQVNLGSTVEALTGKGATGGSDAVGRPRPDAGKKGRARPRPGVNLLGDDDNAPAAAAPWQKEVKVEEKPAILDQILGSPTEPLSDEALQIPCAQIPFSTPVVKVKGEAKDDFQDILGEFDLIRGDKEDTKQGYQTSSTFLLKSILEPQESLDDEFEALATESILKSPVPPKEEEEEEPEEDEDDPFNTKFVEEIIKEKEEPQPEKPKEEDDDDFDFDFDPRAGEPQTTPSPQRPPQKSLLEDNSPTAENCENLPALQPNFTAPTKTGHLVDATGQGGEKDPFDTTSVKVVLPGQAELRLLEEELLNAEVVYPKLPQLEPKFSATPAFVDDDFDPRAEEKEPHIFDAGEEEGREEQIKVLTPQESFQEEEDPFSTDHILHLNLGPGALELKLLESELVTRDDKDNALEDPTKLEDLDFDPRCGEEIDPFVVVVNTQILSTGHIFDHSDDFSPAGKVLTPQQEQAPSFPTTAAAPGDENEEIDPFDTSSIEVIKLLPPSELKAIEGEILAAQPPPVTGTQVKLRAAFSAPAVPLPPKEPLKPQISQFEEDEKPHLLEEEDAFHSGIDHTPLVPLDAEFDPFNTDIAEGLVPGKTEIRYLEEELNSISDPDFDPRQFGASIPSQPQPVHPATLSFVSTTLQPLKLHESLDDTDIDPFDTSAAEALTQKPKPSVPPPPKSDNQLDLKALEAELL